MVRFGAGRLVVVVGALGVAAMAAGCLNDRADLCQDARDCALGDSCTATGFCLRPQDTPAPRVGPMGPLFTGGATFVSDAGDVVLNGQIGSTQMTGPARLFLSRAAQADFMRVQVETVSLPDPAFGFVNFSGPTSQFTQPGTYQMNTQVLGDMGAVACTDEFDVPVDQATITVEPMDDLTDEDREMVRVSFQVSGRNTSTFGSFPLAVD